MNYKFKIIDALWLQDPGRSTRRGVRPRGESCFGRFLNLKFRLDGVQFMKRTGNVKISLDCHLKHMFSYEVSKRLLSLNKRVTFCGIKFLIFLGCTNCNISLFLTSYKEYFSGGETL